LCFLGVNSLWAQAPSKSEVPKATGSYIFPIRPGAQNFLSGTMGELRASHFHAGIDIKTQGVQGLEVYASAAGYVSRIKVAQGGYGNALYIQHPNGTTTVYAHLRNYQEDIARYVRQAQYKNQSFAVELFPEQQDFPVKQGAVVGYSGNSGSSGGPHLHFEIRDGNQRPLNPLKQGFTEIKDNIPPEVRKIALRTMDSNSRINHELGRFEFNVIKKGSYYTTTTPISAFGRIGVEVLAHDKLNGANNRNGVPCMEVTIGGQQVFQQNIERFSFGESRNILVHTDYQTAVTKRQRFAKMYVDDGNKLPFYKTNSNRGLLTIEADSSYQVQINLWDIYNNSSSVLFKLDGEEPQIQLYKGTSSRSNTISYELMDNDLIIKGPATQDNSCAYVYANRMPYEVKPKYTINNQAVMVWDMDQGLPDSLRYLDQVVNLNYQAIMPGAIEFNFYNERLNLHAGANVLFDTVFLSTNYRLDTSKQREVFELFKDVQPLRRHLKVTLKPQLQYEDRKRTSVYSLDRRGNASFVGGTWKDDLIEFRTRSWGNYTLLADSTKPQIKAARINSNDIAFIIKDTMSGIKSFRLEIDGKWVLMNYDYKRNLIWSEKLDPDQPFKGNLQLKVVDNVGNISYYSSKI